MTIWQALCGNQTSETACWLKLWGNTDVELIITWIRAILIHYFLLTISSDYYPDSDDNIGKSRAVTQKQSYTLCVALTWPISCTKECIRWLEHNVHVRLQPEPLLLLSVFKKKKARWWEGFQVDFRPWKFIQT